MRNNREKWHFYSHPSKKELTPPEVRYWKEQVKRLTKVGIEFEFNLPDQKGSCQGDNIQCPCVHIDTGCWAICANIEDCKKIPCYDTCANRSVKCNPEKCAKCKNFEFRCIGTTCADFISACFVCDKFQKSCAACPKKYDPDKDPQKIREILTADLQPSRSYGKINSSGVVTITTDGSLKGGKGVEIITVGRRVDYWEFYTMSKSIIEKVVEYGGYLNERTGSHMHVLTSYYEESGANELERPMPQIILANFHQLCRRYQNALVWMTTALDDPNHLTRWEKFRVSILDVSPVTKDMRKVVEDVSRNAGGNKYGLVNYNSLRFIGEDVERFHVEFRQADSTLCPTYYAAIACLHYALLAKAVEISRYGLLKVGAEGWLKNAKEMKKIILNGVGDYDSSRVSNTAKLLDNVDYFIQESLDLVGQLKGILLKLGPAYDVLLKLAKKPASLRRVDGDKWKDIERDLAVEMGATDKLEIKMSEVIDLKLIDDCRDIKEWVSEVQKMMLEDADLGREVSTSEIMEFVENKTREGEMIWSESTGCLLAV
jgi:hypothetical protein